jgi:branched-chain amino acid transport system substrate-binding protein
MLGAAALIASAASLAIAADRTGVTDQSIKIGLFAPVTGPASVNAKTVYGAAAIYKDVNAHGGINGRKLELIIEDDGCDSTKGIATAKKLISQDEVFLLHGADCSAVALAIRPEISRHPAVPYIVLGASNPAISSPVLPNLFSPVSTSKVQSEQMVEFALTKPGAQKIAIVNIPMNGAPVSSIQRSRSSRSTASNPLRSSRWSAELRTRPLKF